MNKFLLFLVIIIIYIFIGVFIGVILMDDVSRLNVNIVAYKNKENVTHTLTEINNFINASYNVVSASIENCYKYNIIRIKGENEFNRCNYGLLTENDAKSIFYKFLSD